MDLLGKKVTHTTFGEGTIVEIDETRVKVRFDDATKLFVFPDSFKSNFSISDVEADVYIHKKLEGIRTDALRVQKEREKEKELECYVKRLKITDDSHAVFDMSSEDMELAIQNKGVFTGRYVSGKNKGEPRVLRKMNMNSACVLTVKAKDDGEENRIVSGIFMPEEDFVGLKCSAGFIQSHQDYWIPWDYTQTRLMFWDYFPEAERPRRWGNTEMKYISNSIVPQILKDMQRLTPEGVERERIAAFYDYFCRMNQI